MSPSCTNGLFQDHAHQTVMPSMCTEEKVLMRNMSDVPIDFADALIPSIHLARCPDPSPSACFWWGWCLLGKPIQFPACVATAACISSRPFLCSEATTRLSGPAAAAAAAAGGTKAPGTAVSGTTAAGTGAAGATTTAG